MPFKKKLSLRDVPPESICGRIVLVRVDYNVPLDGLHRVTDITRIERTIPTLKYLRAAGAKIVLLSHLGRPKGQRDLKYSLSPVVANLENLLGKKIFFCPETVGPTATETISSLKNGDVLLLENTRFCDEETKGDLDWANQVRHGADIFVNDAFGMAHRSHASVTVVSELVKESGGIAVAGFLMDREIMILGEALTQPERPFVGVLGGAKISGKIDLIEAMLQRVDRLLIGGAMANTFFLAMGHSVGHSLVEKDFVKCATGLLEEFGNKLLLPVDVMTAKTIAKDVIPTLHDLKTIGEYQSVVDIGHRTVRIFSDAIMRAETVIWNGPMGVFEIPSFAQGTFQLAEAAARAASEGTCVILGGGDSAAAAKAAGVLGKMTHVSTGGGATLEFLSGKKLPGYEALSDKKEKELR